MAHLLTASLDQAETACRVALGVWNPEVEGDQALLHDGVAAAPRNDRVRIALKPLLFAEILSAIIDPAERARSPEQF